MGQKLIGIVKLQYAYVSKASPREAKEMVKHVAFDVDGNAWGLVERATQLEDPPDTKPIHRGALWRLDYKRWIRFEAIPFELEERIGPDGFWQMAQPVGT